MSQGAQDVEAKRLSACESGGGARSSPAVPICALDFHCRISAQGRHPLRSRRLAVNNDFLDGVFLYSNSEARYTRLFSERARISHKTRYWGTYGG